MGWTEDVNRPAVAIRDVIHAVLLNRKSLLPVSSLVRGAYGIRDICLSVPSMPYSTGATIIVGRAAGALLIAVSLLTAWHGWKAVA